jgi:hypothetical protein
MDEPVTYRLVILLAFAYTLTLIVIAVGAHS